MLLSAVCNGKVPCVLCDRMLTFLRLYSICGNLRGSVTTADDGAAMDDREPGAYCFANEPEDIGLVCCGQTRETKAAQSSTAPPWWLL